MPPLLPSQEAARRSISAAGLPAAIERQAAAAVEEADALILVVDGQVGPALAMPAVRAGLATCHGTPASSPALHCRTKRAEPAGALRAGAVRSAAAA